MSIGTAIGIHHIPKYCYALTKARNKDSHSTKGVGWKTLLNFRESSLNVAPNACWGENTQRSNISANSTLSTTGNMRIKKKQEKIYSLENGARSASEGDQSLAVYRRRPKDAKHSSKLQHRNAKKELNPRIKPRTNGTLILRRKHPSADTKNKNSTENPG